MRLAGFWGRASQGSSLPPAPLIQIAPTVAFGVVGVNSTWPGGCSLSELTTWTDFRLAGFEPVSSLSEQKTGPGSSRTSLLVDRARCAPKSRINQAHRLWRRRKPTELTCNKLWRRLAPRRSGSRSANSEGSRSTATPTSRRVNPKKSPARNMDRWPYRQTSANRE